MKSKPLSMKKLYILASDFLVKRYEGLVMTETEKAILMSNRDMSLLVEFFNYVWEHRNEK